MNTRTITSPSSETLQTTAQGLGWFSIALGAAEIFLPGQLAKLIGVRPRPLLFLALGLREIAAGVGILSSDRTGSWVWSRVAGDAMDLGLLVAALADDDSEPHRLEGAIAAVAGVTALDIYTAQKLLPLPALHD